MLPLLGIGPQVPLWVSLALADWCVKVAIAIIALPVGLCYIPAYKAVLSNDRYLKYFKQFEKEDAKWHKKWKQITWGFCIGSVVFTIGGIFAMWGVSLLFRK